MLRAGRLVAVLAALATPALAAPSAPAAPSKPATKAAPKPAPAAKVAVTDLKEQTALVITVSAKPAELEGALSKAYFTLFAVSQKAGLSIGGPPLARYLSRGTAKDPTLTVEAGFTVTGKPTGSLGDAKLVTLPAGPAAVLEHTGRREQLLVAHAQLDTWLAREKRTQGSPRWELYLTTPMTTPDPAAQQTRIVVPLAR